MDTTLDEESPRVRLALLLKHFSELDDDREAWRVLYPIKEVLLLVVCAIDRGGPAASPDAEVASCCIGDFRTDEGSSLVRASNAPCWVILAAKASSPPFWRRLLTGDSWPSGGLSPGAVGRLPAAFR